MLCWAAELHSLAVPLACGDTCHLSTTYRVLRGAGTVQTRYTPGKNVSAEAHFVPRPGGGTEEEDDGCANANERTAVPFWNSDLTPRLLCIVTPSTQQPAGR